MRRKWVSGLIGLILVIGCILGFKAYMDNVKIDVTMMETWKPVKMIQPGEMITSEMIHEVQIPAIQHMGNALLDKKQILGKRAIIPIGETEEFLSWKIGPNTLYPTGDENYIGFKIEFVGAVNNMVRRGDKVTAWVEYNEPKVIDSNGNEITVEQQAALLAANPMMSFKKIYTKKLLENLTVAYVKDEDGKEITDETTSTGTLSFPLSGDDKDTVNADHYRQNATGQPAYVTFIMSPEQYEIFAKGAKDGYIRLGLPNSKVMFGAITLQKNLNDIARVPEKLDNSVSADSASTNESTVAKSKGGSSK